MLDMKFRSLTTMVNSEIPGSSSPFNFPSRISRVSLAPSRCGYAKIPIDSGGDTTVETSSICSSVAKRLSYVSGSNSLRASSWFGRRQSGPTT